MAPPETKDGENSNPSQNATPRSNEPSLDSKKHEGPKVKMPLQDALAEYKNARLKLIDESADMNAKIVSKKKDKETENAEKKKERLDREKEKLNRFA